MVFLGERFESEGGSISDNGGVVVVVGCAKIYIFGIRCFLKSKTLQKLQKPSPFHTPLSLSLSVCCSLRIQ